MGACADPSLDRTKSNVAVDCNCYQPLASRPSAGPAPYRVGLKQHEAPSYVVFPYVLTGYRCGGTYTRCMASLFEWHAGE